MFDEPPKPKSSLDDFFASKYAHREHFVINDVQVDSIDIKPKNQKDETPVLIAPGHGATIESSKPGIKVLAEENRRVISLSHPRKGGTVHPLLHNTEIAEWYEKKGQDYPDWPPEELRKAQTILSLLDQERKLRPKITTNQIAFAH